MFVLVVLWLILIIVHSGVILVVEVMGKKKRNVDKDNLDGTSDGLQINQNWIRKKMDEVKEDGDETTVIFN